MKDNWDIDNTQSILHQHPTTRPNGYDFHLTLNSDINKENTRLSISIYFTYTYLHIHTI